MLCLQVVEHGSRHSRIQVEAIDSHSEFAPGEYVSLNLQTVVTGLIS